MGGNPASVLEFCSSSGQRAEYGDEPATLAGERVFPVHQRGPLMEFSASSGGPEFVFGQVARKAVSQEGGFLQAVRFVLFSKRQ